MRIILILALAGAVLTIVLLQKKRGGERGVDTRGGQELTEEEKIQILESLSAPADAPQYTNEEKRKILESLSAPPDQPKLSDEEKKAILESLSAPIK